MFNTLTNTHPIRSSLVFTLVAGAYIGVGRYMKLNRSSLVQQGLAAVIGGIAQKYLAQSELCGSVLCQDCAGDRLTMNQQVGSVLGTCLIAGVVAKICNSSRLVFSALSITAGHFALCQLSQSVAEECVTSWKVNQADFLKLCQEGRLPAVPIIIDQDVALTDLEGDMDWPAEVTIEGSLTIKDCPSFTSLPSRLTCKGDVCIERCPRLDMAETQLDIQGSFTIKDCSSFTYLPTRLTCRGDVCIESCPCLDMVENMLVIGGNLEIANSGITSLLLSLQCKGNISIRVCKRFKTLPDGLQCCGALDIIGCPEFTAIPKNLTVAETMTLQNCENLSFIAEGLHVGNDVSINMCPRLDIAENTLVVGGNLYIQHTAMTSLPPSLQCQGNISIIECKRFKTLPDDLRCHGTLHIAYCPELTAIPKNLTVAETMRLQNCESLRSIADGLHVGINFDTYPGSLIVVSCSALTSLPEGLHVEGDLYLYGSQIETLPQTFQIGGLKLEYCHCFKGLPDKLALKGDLSIITCRRITCLPTELMLGGNLKITLSEGITRLPDGLQVGGHLDLNHSAIQEIPDWVRELGPTSDGKVRIVNFENAPISQKQVDQYKNIQILGMEFILPPTKKPASVDHSSAPRQLFLTPQEIQDLDTLGIGERHHIEQTQINKAYRSLSLVHHPDKNGGNDSSTFIAINEAYERLKHKFRS